jgi:hypothetical protein
MVEGRKAGLIGGGAADRAVRLAGLPHPGAQDLLLIEQQDIRGTV